MAVGRNSGDKGDAGDLRTPEGRFWITGILSGEAKGKMYGPLVFTLNYPRPGDAAEGKTGQGIWIHGVEAGKLPTWTHGCLSLANEDIVALSAYADVGIPVVILPDSLSPDPASQADVAGMEREFPSIMAAHMRQSKADSSAKLELMRRARDYIAKEAKAFPELGMQALTPEAKLAILARLEKWRSDWMSRSIDAYSANYDPAFKDRMGRDRQSFLERKRRIFESKTKIEMEIRDPRIESEGYARARISFRQEYTAEGPQGPQRSSELKSLRLEEGPAGWLIITE
jgi:murein L,D-transpeptidase YafK